MILDGLNKSGLQSRGWTTEKLRERLAECRANIREIKRKDRNSFTYRYLYVSLYEGYKRALAKLA